MYGAGLQEFGEVTRSKVIYDGRDLHRSVFEGPGASVVEATDWR